MRYIIFTLAVCMMGCAALESVETNMIAHHEELCYAETIGMSDYDSEIQFDECMTRE
jgi:folate-dependent tRNA-U54 methylase TrmFO/GidA